MPIYFNDAIDDALVYDSQPRIEGVDSYSRASVIAPSEVAYLQNVELESSGIAKSRRGAWYLSTRTYGTIHAIKYIKNDTWGDPLFIFGNGHVWMETSTENSIVALNAYDATALPENCSCCEINGYIYFTTGSGAIVAVRLDGASTSTLVDSKGNQIVGTDGDRIITNDPVSELVESNDPTNVRSLISHKFRIVCAKNVDELVVSNVLPVPGSTPFAAPTGPVDGTIRVGKGDSDRIVSVVPFKDQRIAVLKEYSIHIVNADPQVSKANWVITQVSDRVGCLAEKSAVSVGDDIVFLARDGVRSIGTAFEQEQIATSDPISFPISDQIENINWENAHKSVATFWRGRYMLAVPMGSATEPDTVLVYNTNLRKWAGIWTGWKPRDFEIIELSNDRRKLVWGDATHNNVLEFRDYIKDSSTIEDDFADNLDGTFSTVPFKLLTRAMSFSDPISPKTLDHVEVEFFRSKSYCDVTVVADGGDDIDIESGRCVDTGTGELRLDFVLPAVLGTPGVKRHAMSLLGSAEGREFQVCIQNTPDDVLTAKGIPSIDQRFISVRNINLGGYVDTLEAQV